MSILCESCTHYRVCMFPTMTPHLHGYCDELEYPFTLGIFKEALPLLPRLAPWQPQNQIEASPPPACGRNAFGPCSTESHHAPLGHRSANG